MDQRPKVEFADNVTEKLTCKFPTAGKNGSGQYGEWWLHTVTWKGADASLFTDEDLQDLIEAAGPERGTELAIRKDKPAGQKHATWKMWRLHDGEWIAIDPRDAPSRAPSGDPPPPQAETPPGEAERAAPPKGAAKFEKLGPRVDQLSPVMAECLNQAAICYGSASFLEVLWGKVVEDGELNPPPAKQDKVDAIQRLAQSLFIAATNDRTVLPPKAPLADYEGPEAPVEQSALGGPDDDLPF